MNFVNAKEKQILIDGVKINYKQIGEGDIPIILLHGWGVDSDKYSALAEYLSEVKSEKLKAKSYCIYLLDLPGFGKSDNPSETWGVDEYAKFVKKFIFSLGNTEPRVILIGHSFGGRIAIKFAVQYPEKLQSLILTGAAGIKHSATVKIKLFLLLAKIGKAFFSLPLLKGFAKSAEKILYRVAREKDYWQAQGIMKEVFKKIIGEDLTPCLKKIKTPTLLIWGANDRSTPLKDAYVMNKKISNSKLKIIEATNHSLPYQKPEKFAKIAKDFIYKLF